MFFIKNIHKGLYSHLIFYPVPLNLNYFFGFGFLSFVCLLMQVLTGIFLSMHYTAHVSFAFNSVEHLLRDVNSGWFLRYLHSNGASFFFIVVYVHIIRGLYYESYSGLRSFIWLSGLFIFFLMMATAFMGYVLPWGQMSFWGATVIINLFTAFPVFGQEVATFLWGGFSVANPTLNRFFSLHYFLPFIIVGVVFVHIAILHTVGSSNVLNRYKSVNNIFFYPYFFVKDIVGLFFFIFFLFFFIFFYSNSLGHPDNYIEANPMVTPLHIVPEWYFLPFYAILRTIPDKLGGVLCMFASILILFYLPLLKFRGHCVSNLYSLNNLGSIYLVIRNFGLFFFCFFSCCLGWLGANSVEEPYVLFSKFCTFFYFFYFFVFLFFSSLVELFYYFSTFWVGEEVKLKRLVQPFSRTSRVICAKPPTVTSKLFAILPFRVSVFYINMKHEFSRRGAVYRYFESM